MASDTRRASNAEASTSLPVYDGHSVSGYEKIHRIGEGTYGVVYKARDRETGEIVALKCVRFDRSRDGVPVTSVRELRVLQSCSHPNIVQLKKVVTGPKADSVFLVFEYCEHDLGRLVDAMPSQKQFSLSEVKCLVKQLLEAVQYLHEHWTVHRDLKLSNLLYTHSGQLKLCDFGLARHFDRGFTPMTPRVVTLWYRAPEVLLGSDAYDEAVDMWAVGCIIGELLRHQPLFPARNEMECLHMMCNMLGSPGPHIWPGMTKLSAATKLVWPEQPYNYLKKTFPEVSEQGIHLLNACLTYDPVKRINAADALRHPFFTERPYPKHSHEMPAFPSSHLPPQPHPSHQQQHHHHQAQQSAGTTGPGNSLAAAAAAAVADRPRNPQRTAAQVQESREAYALHGPTKRTGAMLDEDHTRGHRGFQQQQQFDRGGKDGKGLPNGYGDVRFGGFAERYNNAPSKKAYAFMRRK